MISSNFFLREDFHFCFINELSMKNIEPNTKRSYQTIIMARQVYVFCDWSMLLIILIIHINKTEIKTFAKLEKLFKIIQILFIISLLVFGIYLLIVKVKIIRCNIKFHY